MMEETAKVILRSIGVDQVAKQMVSRWRPMWISKHGATIAFLSQFVHKGDLCFDVGANIGTMTKAYLMLGGRVVAVEPQISCVQRLRQHFHNDENVTIVNAAVGESEGYADMWICDDRRTISTLNNRWKTDSRHAHDHKWNRSMKVPITTLDALIAKYGIPQFCKIDVEGYEAAVMHGLSIPIPALSFEYTKEFHDVAAECFRHLTTLGQPIFNFSITGSQTLAFPTWVTAEHLCEKLRLWDDDLLAGDIYCRFVHCDDNAVKNR